MSKELMCPKKVAYEWSLWCGENKWTKAMEDLADVGCKIIWWCGYPQSASAIPLCFVIYLPDNSKFQGKSRLKDIIAAKLAAEKIFVHSKS